MIEDLNILVTAGYTGECRCGGTCDRAAVDSGRDHWYITMGHAGFNSPANNGFGYSSERNARAAIKRYENRRQPVTQGQEARLDQSPWEVIMIPR